IVGPFYLTQGLGLSPGLVGLTLSAGPLVAAVTAWPAGRQVDAWGSTRVALVGLGTMLFGTASLAALLPQGGITGYIGPIVCTTAGYAMFQAGNTTAVM